MTDTPAEHERDRILSKARERGDFVCGDDGYFVYWQLEGSGSVAAYELRILADELDDMNKEWDAMLQKDTSI